jgi:hypothetical protein
MEIGTANSLQSRLEVARGHMNAISESRVKYVPGDHLAMAEDAIRRAQQSARACMTIMDQIRRMIEDDVSAERARQNARAQLGI